MRGVRGHRRVGRYRVGSTRYHGLAGVKLVVRAFANEACHQNRYPIPTM